MKADNKKYYNMLYQQIVEETAEKFAERLKAKQAPLDEYDEISIGSLFSDIDETYKEILNETTKKY